ncbi:MAG TPA: hypothetical protein VG389_25550 [Myxococcota bacterium]|jgi:hypothetical protein|nr:hypothetical protein [Myxococcota bacterium]
MAENKAVKLKPMLLPRFRCAADHPESKESKTYDKAGHLIKKETVVVEHAWLSNLYVLWTRTDDPLLEYYLGQTDEDGYLSPIASEWSPDAKRTEPLVAGKQYAFIFVRHPEAKLPGVALAELNSNMPAADKKARWGEAYVVTPVKELTGKRQDPVKKTEEEIWELVVRVPEKPELYAPRGSSLYKGWVLFRGMPNAGCPVVQEQVTRLQFHLGALRYVVGNSWFPYSPEPKEGKNVGWGTVRSYPTIGWNEGVFDVMTWAAVLGLQRDATAQLAAQIDSASGRKPPFAGADHEITAVARDEERAESPKYLAVLPVPPSLPAAKFEHETLVDKVTGDTIRLWLDKGYRKADQVLVAWDAKKVDWLRSDVYTRVQDWSKALVDAGFEYGVQLANAYRDVRIGTRSPGHGMVDTSLHKTGLAVDLFTNDFLPGSSKGVTYPIWIVNDTPGAEAPFFTVWAEVPTAKKQTDPPPEVEYKASIEPWQYDPDSLEGGHKLPPKVWGGIEFLNVTKLAKKFGFERIQPHPEWLGGKLDTLPVWNPHAFRDLMKRLKIQLLKENDTRPAGQVFLMDTTAVPREEFKKVYDLLDDWRAATAAAGGGVAIHLEPGTTTFKEVTTALSARAWKFAGKTFRATRAAGGAVSTVTILADRAKWTATCPSDPFSLQPITTPLLGPTSTVTCPAFKGQKGHMEWWHFQLNALRNNDDGKPKLWKLLILQLGFEREALLGPEGKASILGQYGLGYGPEAMERLAY